MYSDCSSTFIHQGHMGMPLRLSFSKIPFWYCKSHEQRAKVFLANIITKTHPYGNAVNPFTVPKATTFVRSTKLLVEDNNSGAHKRGTSDKTGQKTHGWSEKGAKPVGIPPPPPPLLPPTLPSLPLRPLPTLSSPRVPLASYAKSHNGLSFAKVDNVHNSHNNLLSSGEELNVLGWVTAACKDSNVPAPVVAEEVQDSSVENVENIGHVGDLAENVRNIGSHPSRPSPSQLSQPTPSRPS
ncbi:hypothetical protein HD553DRAFT_325697 [Filobasidium floriforme]|uniref:uncharacterized protein n=1 Tax=Filobasidium floriforme TaxID=5210 RepID=UPI001E8DC22D|nr:uncharacterized protein HD553DRAFT_325697 [Filobasidium floriforme]KAH8081262.1 hypothetical protein HD553DRAFT_325697 [Filobasidium floriforme]